MTIICGHKSMIIGANQCFIRSLSVLLLLIPPGFCDTVQYKDPISNIHPVALQSHISNISLKLSSTSEKPNSRSILNRSSDAKRLTNPINIPTVSISNNGFGSSTTAFNTSSDPSTMNERQRAQKIQCSKTVPECTLLTPGNATVNATCFGTDLGYTSVYLADKTYWEVQSLLSTRLPLRYAPKCWEKIQPLLCAYYLSECRLNHGGHSNNNEAFSSIDMIPKNICFEAREKCEVIYSTSIVTTSGENQWPEFLNCDNQAIFYEDQQFWFFENNSNMQRKNDNITCQAVDQLKEISLDKKIIDKYPINNFWSKKFNKTEGKCLFPYFLPTNKSYYDGIEGCDLNCQSPQYTSDERNFVTNGYFAAVCVAFVCNILASITIVIVNCQKNKQVNCRNNDITTYPNHIVLVMQMLCVGFSLFNLMIWKIIGIEKVACRDDGTRIHGKPTNEFGTCGISLFLNFFFFAALTLWSIFLSYTWNASYRKIRSRTKNAAITTRKDSPYGLNSAVIHAFTWIFSGIFAIIASQVGNMNTVIEGNSLIGTCFITSGTSNLLYLWLVLIPIITMLVVKVGFTCHSYFMLYGFLRTAKAKKSSNIAIKKIYHTFFSIARLIVPLTIVVVLFVGLSLYNMIQAGVREQSEKKFLISKFKQAALEENYYFTPNSQHHTTKLSDPTDRQTPINVLLQALCQPICCILVSLLVSPQAGYQTWKKFLIAAYKAFKTALHYIMYEKEKETVIEMDMQNPDNKELNVMEKNGAKIPKVKKLELIAQAWAKRYDVQRTGHLDLTLSEEEDEEGVKDDQLPSTQAGVAGVLDTLETSNYQREASEFNSFTEFEDFVHALPRIVQRRGACSGAFELGLKPWGSVDSNLHLSRTVSIRSSRIGGFSFNSCRSSFAGSRLGNGDSQYSANYQSDFSEYLYGLHRDSKGKGKTKKFVKRFSKRSLKSTDVVSSKDTSIQNSVASEDQNVTILPAITVQQSPITVNSTKECDFKDITVTKLNQMKSRLCDKQLKVPAPGKSINITANANDIPPRYEALIDCHKFDSKYVISSKETYLSEEGNSRASYVNQICPPENISYEQVAVQTSLTDISTLGRRPPTRDKTTQHNADTAVPSSNIMHLVQHTLANATSTTSSSQTETNFFLPKTLTESPTKIKNCGQHINANVVRIQLGSHDNSSKIEEADVHRTLKGSFSEASSSIPSSYEKTCDETIIVNSPTVDSKKDSKHEVALAIKEMANDQTNDDLPPLTKPLTIPILPPSSPSHNRARRGGIIPKKSDIAQLATLNRPRIPVLTIPPPPLEPPNYSRKDLDMENFSPNSYFLNKFPVPSAITMSGTTFTTLEELEIKSSIPRSDGSINAQLQSMPDSIVRISISTPSS